MGNVVIYYCADLNERTEQAISNVNSMVKKIERDHVLLGVFIDSYDKSTELMELISSPLEKLDILFLNRPVENEFDTELISQLGRADHFKIKIFNQIE
ncbi:hypothetical protein QTG56_01440 [Rossellomorea sp. AcN35-11]|nr:hypothetical protein [Rossellomorea aquimaris]WJV29859.1 hypothetical protein QTG56_01440 [Rossellomorea sp. AcN35-11]